MLCYEVKLEKEKEINCQELNPNTQLELPVFCHWVTTTLMILYILHKW